MEKTYKITACYYNHHGEDRHEEPITFIDGQHFLTSLKYRETIWNLNLKFDRINIYNSDNKLIESFYRPTDINHPNDLDYATNIGLDKYAKYTLDVANRSTCSAKHVGAIIIDSDTQHIVSMGYNDSIGSQKCQDVFIHASDSWYRRDREVNYEITPCENSQEHHHWSLIHETHAEVNAVINLLKNNDVKDTDNYTMFVTHCPCYDCAKIIARTSCIKTLYYMKSYDYESEVVDFLISIGIQVKKYSSTER